MQTLSVNTTYTNGLATALGASCPLVLNGRETGLKVWSNGLVRRVYSIAPSLAVLGFSILLTFSLIYFQGTLSRLGEWGYLGGFLTQLIGSASVAVPAPWGAYTFAAGAALNPILLRVVGGLGAAFGEITGYYVDVKGRSLVHGGRLDNK